MRSSKPPPPPPSAVPLPRERGRIRVSYGIAAGSSLRSGGGGPREAWWRGLSSNHPHFFPTFFGFSAFALAADFATLDFSSGFFFASFESCFV